MAVRTGALSFAYVKYSADKRLETLLLTHGVTAEWEVFRHSGREDKQRSISGSFEVEIYLTV